MKSDIEWRVDISGTLDLYAPWLDLDIALDIYSMHLVDFDFELSSPILVCVECNDLIFRQYRYPKTRWARPYWMQVVWFGHN